MGLSGAVDVVTWSERIIVGGHAINASAVGILVSFPVPAVPVQVGDRCLVTVRLPSGLLHLPGHVRRKEPGDDGRYYVGVELDPLHDDDLHFLRDGSIDG